jgi:hypothetical protein
MPSLRASYTPGEVQNMDQSSLKPLMPRFKKLLTQQDTVPTEEATQAVDYEAVSAARAAKAEAIQQFNTVAVPLIFYNQSAWDAQDDSWVAECLQEWIAPDDSGIDAMFRGLGDPSGPPSEPDLGSFIDQINDRVNEWQNDKELATPQLNPDFDPENPLDGTQYYKYAERWQGEGKQWLYAAEPSDDPADWATMQERYDQYEAALGAPGQKEIIEPYGQGFMKAVEGRWRYGSSRDAATWYGDYDAMLAAEGLIESRQDEPAATFATAEEAQEGAALVIDLVQETLNKAVTALPDEVAAVLTPQELENLAIEANKAVAGQS